jgi:hypothetical protein
VKPSFFTDSAPPSITAIPPMKKMIKAELWKKKLEKPIQTGKFGADMKK